MLLLQASLQRNSPYPQDVTTHLKKKLNIQKNIIKLILILVCGITYIQTSKENSIYIKYKWDKNDNSISIISSEEKELSWGVALEIASLENDSNFQKRSAGDTYQVSCSNGGNSWDKECSGKWSCGGLIADCLDEGGCASICTLYMEYYEPELTFFLESTPFTGR